MSLKLSLQNSKKNVFLILRIGHNNQTFEGKHTPKIEIKRYSILLTNKPNQYIAGWNFVYRYQIWRKSVENYDF